MNIEKYITPFIKSQFPSFYEDEGPLFIAFVKAYYQWLEASSDINQNNVIRQSRSLLEYRDIDSSPDTFVKYFKDKYIDSLPENLLADKRMLIKHILEFYRSKGTNESFNFLFKILFNEDIDIYIPANNIFKLSDGQWTVPVYIEVSDSPYLKDLIGKEIYSSSTHATAIVDNYFTKPINQKLVNVLLLNNVQGRFKYGEKILSKDISLLDINNAPLIFGSLNSISIINGGLGFSIGDNLDIQGSGDGGKAYVSAITNRNGEVEFSLIKGGTGFSLDAVINVVGDSLLISNITQSNPATVTTSVPHGLSNTNTVRIDYVEGMTNINIPDYSYYIKTSNSTSFSLYTDVLLSNTINSSSYQSYFANSGYVFLNTGGAGATFQIGSIVNKEIYQINTDIINDYYNTVIDDTISGYTLSISNTNGTFVANNKIYMNNIDIREVDCSQLSHSILAVGENLSNSSLGIANLSVVISDGSYLVVKGNDMTNSNLVHGTVLVSNTSSTQLVINTLFPISTVNCTANVVFVNSSVLSVDWQSNYFVVGETVYNSNSVSNTVVTSIIRNTNWGFPVVSIPDIENMDSIIEKTLSIVNKEVGTIASLKNINPGNGYNKNPSVITVEPLIYQLQIYEPDNTIKGFNAVIDAVAQNAKGIVSAIDMNDSGYGYDRDQMVELSSSNNNYAVTGTTVVNMEGKGKGYWKDNRSFVSDFMYLQDSNYYQNYSYEIIASRMMDTYEKHVKNLVHPVGMKMFGRFVNKNELTNQSVELVSSSFSQA